MGKFSQPAERPGTLFLWALLWGLALAGGSARAVVLAGDDFSYPDGSTLNQQNGGTGFLSPWLSPGFNSPYAGNAPLLMQNGQVTFNPAGPNGQGDFYRQNSFRQLPFSFQALHQYWISFDLRSLAGGVTRGNFQGLSFYESGGTERLFVGHSTYLSQDNSWRMVQQPGNIYQSSASTHVSSVDAPRHGVLELIVGNPTSTAKLWVGADATNPVDVSRAADATAGGLSLLSVGYLAVAGDASFTFDNLKLGTSAADVGAVVPEPSSLALLAGGVLLLAWRKAPNGEEASRRPSPRHRTIASNRLI